MAAEKGDYPLSQALSSVYGEGSVIPTIVAVIGLFGLIASLHGIIMGYSRQTYALARVGYFPRGLAKVNKKGVPVWSLLVPGSIAVICAGSATFANALMILSVFGAVVMYCISMVSLFILRRKEPDLEKPFKVIYPIVPGIALVLGLVCLYSIVRYSVFTTSLSLFGMTVPLTYVISFIFIGAILYYVLRGTKQVQSASQKLDSSVEL
ncbi:amino acid permease [Ectobacillus funiculus]|uniref:Amino acid permease n=1 Tax=Ectobacillus funiculus TaxID=137993 RepID=A0ABV5WEL2_9BACI